LCWYKFIAFSDKVLEWKTKNDSYSLFRSHSTMLDNVKCAGHVQCPQWKVMNLLFGFDYLWYGIMLIQYLHINLMLDVFYQVQTLTMYLEKFLSFVSMMVNLMNLRWTIDSGNMILSKMWSVLVDRTAEKRVL
jgi:hypothetical protein